MVTTTRGNNIPRGGWHNKAPYRTTHKRIPEELKPEVEKLVARYRAIVMNGGVYTPLVTEEGTGDKVTLTLEEGIDLAKQIKKQKKSGSKSLIRFLEKLFGLPCNSIEL